MIFDKSLGRMDGMSDKEKISYIANHIRVLQEQLEYRLTNLDSSNITSIDTNQTQLEGDSIDSIEGLANTVGGLSNTVGDLSNSYSTLRQTVGSLSSTVASQGQSISSLTQTSSSLTASVQNLQTGEKTYLRMDATGVSVVDGNGQSVTISKGNLSLTGAIAWTDLAADAQNQVNSAQTAAANAHSMAASIANGTCNGTFINGTSIYSPTIYGNVFSVLPRSLADTSGSFNLYGYYGSSLFQFLQIQYASATPPYINFNSPGGAYAQFNFSSMEMYGAVCMHSSYGTSLPGSGKTGQVFFLIE